MRIVNVIGVYEIGDYCKCESATGGVVVDSGRKQYSIWTYFTVVYPNIIAVYYANFYSNILIGQSAAVSSCSLFSE